jgi:hypothetical protein
MLRSIKIQGARAAASSLGVQAKIIQNRAIMIRAKNDMLYGKVRARAWAVPVILFGAQQNLTGVTYGRRKNIPHAFIAKAKISNLDRMVFTRKTPRPRPLRGEKVPIEEPYREGLYARTAELERAFDKMLMKELKRARGLFKKDKK